MLTFQNLYEEAQSQAQDTSAASLVVIKRGINQGMKKFGAILNREWRNVERTFSLVADQQYYQLPEDSIRPKSVTVTIGSVAYPLTEIADEETWRELTMRTHSGSVPECYYVKSDDEFGIWPTPSASVSNAGLLTFEARMRDMVQADYTTGTLAITTGTAAVVGTATTFTANMVGRYLNVTSEAGDGNFYRVASFTDATHITLENNYAGASVSGVNYLIGEVPDIPDEFHEALIDYGLYRYYTRRRDATMARECKNRFDQSLSECMADYSSKSASQYYMKPRIRSGYHHVNRDLRVT